jgi:hypothetical protein
MVVDGAGHDLGFKGKAGRELTAKVLGEFERFFL